MNKLAKFCTNLVLSGEKGLDNIPDKLKSQTVNELLSIGYFTNENIDSLKSSKVSEMSDKCNSVIVKGIDVVLSDKKSYHFSLTNYDQMMISQLAIRAKNGETFLPWHCDNGDCKIYSSEDMIHIASDMEQYITYHLTYFNSLKKYILSMTEVDDIANVEYGIVIPVEYRSEVLTTLLSEETIKGGKQNEESV